MTPRGLALLLGGLLLIAAGWATGWPELTAVGAGAVALVLSALLALGPAPAMKVTLDHAQLRVVRGQEARALVTLTSRRRSRALRLVTGQRDDPVLTVPVPLMAPGEPVVLTIPLDTSTRGEHPIGPFEVVKSDPWSIVVRSAGRASAGAVLVRPQTHPVRRRLSADVRAGESDRSTRTRGDDHFFALRDYVFGDEPRSVHWRSSARAGHLVVRQEVRAASEGSTVVLDTDMSAYATQEAFNSRFLAERFEEAVEVAASLCVAATGEQVHLVRTRRGAPIVTSDVAASQPVVDALALVIAHAPVDAAPEDLPALVRRTHAARLIVVTGSPSPQLVSAVRLASRGVASTLVVRVGAREPNLPGLRVLDIQSAKDLA